MQAIRESLVVRAIFACAVSVLVTGAFCLAYNWAKGIAEPAGDAFVWAVINVAPFAAAFEIGRGAKQNAGLRLACLLAAALCSIGLSWTAGSPNLAFEIVRRLPALALVTVLWLLCDSVPVAVKRRLADPGELPVEPTAVRMVRSAGNYVELYTATGIVLHRGTLVALHKMLGHRFVRVHRQVLVDQSLIARVRREDVVLIDGATLPLGQRYRAAVLAALPA